MFHQIWILQTMHAVLLNSCRKKCKWGSLKFKMIDFSWTFNVQLYLINHPQGFDFRNFPFLRTKTNVQGRVFCVSKNLSLSSLRSSFHFRTPLCLLFVYGDNCSPWYSGIYFCSRITCLCSLCSAISWYTPRNYVTVKNVTRLAKVIPFMEFWSYFFKLWFTRWAINSVSNTCDVI